MSKPATDKPDILLFMSDQHNPLIMGLAGDKIISTPNLDRIASEGTAFMNAYTSCPLCVPARASMLTSQLPSHNGIITNSGIMSSEQATFVHCLAAEGYEAVLCGRMHFLGPDQRHGFTKRLVGDFTPCYHGRYGGKRTDLGPYVNTPAGAFTKLYGGGTSPVLEYDKAVITAALDYLKQPHEKPVFLLVGTYGPHHTFVAPEALYRKYQDKVRGPDSAAGASIHPLLEERRKSLTPDVVHALRAAYYGMVEQIDSQVGEIQRAWREHLKRTGRKGVFLYTSDHGEQLGERDLWGKMTFYEGSARIPWVAHGDGVKAGNRVETPCSIMDIGPTLCDIAGASRPPEHDGVSLLDTLKGNRTDSGRVVKSEVHLTHGPTGRKTVGRMVRQGKWKYVSYAGFEIDDQLFDMESDPHERVNCIGDNPAVARTLKKTLLEGWDPDRIVQDQERRAAHWAILGRWGNNSDVEEPDRWPIPKSSWELPKP